MADNDKPQKNKAVALGFDIDKDQAPRVLAKGEGSMADQIIKIAKEHGIEIKEDSNLVEILSALELDEFIPLEAYAAVAEILKLIYSKQGKKVK